MESFNGSRVILAAGYYGRSETVNRDAADSAERLSNVETMVRALARKRVAASGAGFPTLAAFTQVAQRTLCGPRFAVEPALVEMACAAVWGEPVPDDYAAVVRGAQDAAEWMGAA